MRRRLWLSLAMLVAGASLLVATSLASAGGHGPTLRKGGIFTLGLVNHSVSIDPQLAYEPTLWWLEYATGAKLYNYPDKAGPAGTKLVPEVASKLTVSNSGKRYTFTIRKGFRFSDGTPVRAKHFKYAIERVANHNLASPGVDLIADPSGTNIVGAQAAVDGDTDKVSGVVVNGDRLIVNLTRPDPTFMAKITMPFFQATSTRLPLTKEIVNVNGSNLPSAGPYYFSLNKVDQLTTIRQNPYWKSGPGRHRPRRLAGVNVQWNLSQNTAFLQLMAGELDLAMPVPATQMAQLARQFGVNKSRFWTKPANGTGWLVMNTSRPLFKNVKLRKALNYAVSRKDYIDMAGPFSGQPWSHILNPGVPGWKNIQPYPLRAPNIVKARKLAGSLKDKKINVWYPTADSYDPDGPAQVQIVRRDLIRLGFKPENISMKGFAGYQIYAAMGIRGNQADLGVSMGWLADYPDPYNWINTLFYGKSITANQNLNKSYFKSAKWDRRMEQASRLTGAARLRAYGQLDIDLMRQAAPVVPMQTINAVYMFSKRVDPRSLIFQPIYADWSIPALALK